MAAGRDQFYNGHCANGEITAVLARPRLKKFLGADEAETPVENIGTRALILDEPPSVSLSLDPKDNPILAAAIAGKADVIVSGERLSNALFLVSESGTH